MAKLKGRDGSLSVATNAVAELREWGLTRTAGSIDCNTMGSGEWDKSESGRKMWNAEASCFYDPADTNGQMAFTIGDEVACEFFPEGDTSGNQVLSGTARVEELEITGEGEGDSYFEFSVKLKGVGALTTGSVT